MVGLELEALYQITPADRFGLSVSYSDGYYVDKPTAFAAGVANSHLSGVIPWQIDPTYQHVFNLPHDQTLTFEAEALFHSSWLVTDYGPSEAVNYQTLQTYLKNGSSLQGNFNLTYNFLPQVSVGAYIRNAGNSVYKTEVSLTSSVVSQNTAQLSEPRTFGAVLSARF
jgi:outer membrane receptor protein involved in Fe transport